MEKPVRTTTIQYKWIAAREAYLPTNMTVVIQEEIDVPQEPQNEDPQSEDPETPEITDVERTRIRNIWQNATTEEEE